MMAGMSTRVIHFVSPGPIPEFLYYAPRENIASLEELISVTARVGKGRNGLHDVENLLQLYREYTSVEVADTELSQTPWGISFIVNNPISKALQGARALGVDLPIVEQPERLNVLIPWTHLKAITKVA